MRNECRGKYIEIRLRSYSNGTKEEMERIPKQGKTRPSFLLVSLLPFVILFFLKIMTKNKEKRINVNEEREQIDEKDERKREK